LQVASTADVGLDGYDTASKLPASLVETLAIASR
jgi:hypothetical protein